MWDHLSEDYLHQYILNTLFYPFSVRFGYIKENIEQFKSDLKTIKPKIEQIFDFEKVILHRINEDERMFLKSGPYNYFRSVLRDRWNILNNFKVYFMNYCHWSVCSAYFLPLFI